MPVQRRGLVEDLALQLLQRRSGVDAQLLGQPLLDRPQHAEGVGLPPGPVERQAQQLAAVLAQRMGPGEGLQLGHRHLVGPHGEQCRAARLDDRQLQLLQPGHLGHHRGGGGHLGVGLPPPQRQPGLELAERPPRVVPVPRLPARGGVLAEPVDVDVDHPAVQQVAAGDGAQHAGRRPGCPVRLQRPAQVGHVRLQRGHRRRRRVPGPQRLEHHLHGDPLADLADQQREQGALLGRAEVDLAAGDHRLHRAERRELHQHLGRARDRRLGLGPAQGAGEPPARGPDRDGVGHPSALPAAGERG
uniref:Uncharacterized protein n=1 Tax=uncultured bacterium esnapd16.1 TaxID=1366596 RepID=S5TLF2_9BACT|nr:hypothetical protein [uncultured bacterium esnapd16.1]